MALFLALILSPLIGFGISVMVYCTLLRSSNAIGEEECDKIHYVKGIRFTDRTESKRRSDLDGFVSNHSIPLSLPYTEPDPNLLCVAFDQETLEMFDLTSSAPAPKYAGPKVSSLVMQNTSVVPDMGLSGGIEDEFEKWEREHGNDIDKPVFKN